MAKFTNPYKAFMPFTAAALPADADEIAADPHNHSKDPSGGSWRTMGLIPSFDGSYWHALDGAGALLHVQFNERILPGKVRDEMLKKEVEKIERLNARKINKKDYAQLRDQVEFDLLPRAFIRRTVVPVFFVKQGSRLLICTSSAKRADDVIAFLRGTFGTDFKTSNIEFARIQPNQFLLNIAQDGPVYGHAGSTFTGGNSGVFKGDHKRTIRVKNRDMESPEVQEIIGNGYNPSELEISFEESEGVGENSVFTLSDAFTFKRVEHTGVTKATQSDADLHALAWAALKAHSLLLETIAATLVERVPETEDDEL